jgi:hypothetical protein
MPARHGSAFHLLNAGSSCMHSGPPAQFETILYEFHADKLL